MSSCFCSDSRVATASSAPDGVLNFQTVSVAMVDALLCRVAAHIINGPRGSGLTLAGWSDVVRPPAHPRRVACAEPPRARLSGHPRQGRGAMSATYEVTIRGRLSPALASEF